MIRHEANLAWALALAAKPHLDAVERNYIFVAIGAGETFAAIRTLLKWVAIKRIPVEPDLVRQCVSWLDAYVGHRGRALPSSPDRGLCVSNRDSTFGNVNGSTGCQPHHNEPSRLRLPGLRHFHGPGTGRGHLGRGARTRAQAAPVPAPSQRRPRRPASAGDRVGGEYGLGFGQREHLDTARSAGRSAAAPRRSGEDQILHQFEAVDLMCNARDKTGQGRQRAHGIFVSGVAGVDDPRSIGVVGDLGGSVRRLGRHACPHGTDHSATVSSTGLGQGVRGCSQTSWRTTTR